MGVALALIVALGLGGLIWNKLRPREDVPIERSAAPEKRVGTSGAGTLTTVNVVAEPDRWSKPIVLPPAVRFSIEIDGRVRIRNGNRVYFGEPHATQSMGEGLSRRFEFKSAEPRPVKVSISYDTGE